MCSEEEEEEEEEEGNSNPYKSDCYCLGRMR
jgi:hypothetical protein